MESKIHSNKEDKKTFKNKQKTMELELSSRFRMQPISCSYIWQRWEWYEHLNANLHK